MAEPVVHFEIPADDMARASAFYRDAFGWWIETYPGFEGCAGVHTKTEDGSGINGGMLRRTEPVTGPVVTVSVKDVHTAEARVAEVGGRVVRGSEPVGEMGFAAYVEDTEGNLFGLWEGTDTTG
jgi:predicted enzyme related to lactoylglutathione lyase